MTPKDPIKEESLDPANWDQLRQLLHDMVDDSVDYISSIRDKAPWQKMPLEVREHYNQAYPKAGQGATATYEEFKKWVLPYTMGNAHPKFWPWYMGNGSMMGAMAEYLTAIINSNAGAGDHVGQRLEDQVIQWMISIIGYPKTASGILTSGGSMANFVGLAVARNAKAGYDIRNEGMRTGTKQMVIYASTEVHNCNQKAAQLLGIGDRYLKRLPVKSDYTMDLDLLRSTIQADKKAGLQPICVIGSAGTVNTGSIDDLNAIADICDEENLWFHIDGAIGAIANLSEKIKPLLSGIERSDSVVLDLHKWMHIPFEAGCVLVRERRDHRDTFAVSAEYLKVNHGGLASGRDWYSEYGLQLSRRLNALKVWMSIKEQGLDKYGRLITQNVEQAHYLGQLINSHDCLELMAPIVLDIVCYRYNPPQQLTLDELNQLNENILVQLHERGLAIPSYTTLNGAYCIRVAITNHRSKFKDFADLAHDTVYLGEELMSTPINQ